MGRKPDVALLPGVAEFMQSGSAPRPFAVENYRDGQHIIAWVATSGAVNPAEPHDVTYRNALCGEPEGYETERLCRKCGAVSEENVLCAGCNGRTELRRSVARRAEPLDFGPAMRWEERRVDPVTDKTLKRVKFGRLSEYRRACPDATERNRREDLQIFGNSPPDKTFRLAGS